MRLLDLYCGAGGAGTGYHRAGFEVVGVDIAPQPRYPFEFHKANASVYLLAHGQEFDAIHASPPCQWYTRGRAKWRGTESRWRRSIPPIRNLLVRTGKPYVIENVKDAGWDMRGPVTLCGCMFNLSTTDTDGTLLHLQRPRLFETNWPLVAPRDCDHSDHQWVAGAYDGARRYKTEAKYVRQGGYVPSSRSVVKALLGIDYSIGWDELFECVPPAYTEWIGGMLCGVVSPYAGVQQDDQPVQNR